MKFAFALVLAMLLFSGCTRIGGRVDASIDANSPGYIPQQPGTENTEKQETGHEKSGGENASPEGRLKEIERVINALMQDKLVIGIDRYDSMEAELNGLENLGIAKEKIEELKGKLLTLKPAGSAPEPTDGNGGNVSIQSRFLAVKNEINEILDLGSYLSQEHYNRIESDLDSFEKQGINKQEIDELREKIAPLNPAGIDSTPKGTSGTLAMIEKEKQILESLPDCGSKKFTVPIVDLQELDEISRLGSIGPPGHTTPTQHMYFHIYSGGQTTSTVALKAPGDITIYGIGSGFDTKGNITEYSIGFALCKDIHGYFNHVKGISESLKNALEQAGCRYANEPQEKCTKDIQYKAAAGDEIGRVGHLQGNFDFGVLDYRAKNIFANPSRYGEDNNGLSRPASLYATCPLDYYEDATKTQLYSKVSGTGMPKCGKIMQDIPGTLQGNWFNGQDTFIYNNWEKQLAFVHDNVDPSKAVVSVGGNFMPASEWIFNPQNAGTINREFSDVKADGGIYCFEQSGSGKILVQMANDTELKIEHLQGSCGASEQFSSPTVYNR